MQCDWHQGDRLVRGLGGCFSFKFSLYWTGYSTFPLGKQYWVDQTLKGKFVWVKSNLCFLMTRSRLVLWMLFLTGSRFDFWLTHFVWPAGGGRVSKAMLFPSGLLSQFQGGICSSAFWTVFPVTKLLLPTKLMNIMNQGDHVMSPLDVKLRIWIGVTNVGNGAQMTCVRVATPGIKVPTFNLGVDTSRLHKSTYSPDYCW